MNHSLKSLSSLLAPAASLCMPASFLESLQIGATGIHSRALSSLAASISGRQSTSVQAGDGKQHPYSQTRICQLQPLRSLVAQSKATLQQPAHQLSAPKLQSQAASNTIRDIFATAVPTKKLAITDPVSMKAKLIFDNCWNKLTARVKDYVCPREIVWLNGAPGSGKGTNISFLCKIRGISRSVTMSQLLDNSAEIKDMVNKGELVPDTLVLDALLDAILNPDRNDGSGLVIDGFPRTALQVDFVKLLHDRLLELHNKHADTPDEFRFPRPSFKVVILYVDEDESVRRQLNRAKLAKLHNQRVMEAGTGDVWDVRTTDVSPELCRRRYQVFKAHYNTILRLKSFFAFSLIDAMGTMQEARDQIMRELRYQSSLDLDERTYQAIRHLPLARDLVRVARQRLVFRLDAYCKKHNKLFLDVIKLIDSEIIPLLKQCSLAGHAEYKTRHPVFLKQPTAVDMLIDILSDRGFSVAHSEEDITIPKNVDLKTGELTCVTEQVHKFRITFDKENVRDLSAPVTVSTKSGDEVAIGTTVVPAHMQREDMKRRMLDPSSVPHSVTEASFGAGAAAGVGAGYTGVGVVAGQDNEGAMGPSASSGTGGANGDVNGSRSSHEDGIANGDEEVEFLTGYESMDAEFSSRTYGYLAMNDRED